MSKSLLVLILALLLALLTFFVITGVADAADVDLAWDANPAKDNVTGYRVFSRTGPAYDYTTPAWQGPETTATVQTEGQTAFVVRAYRVEQLDGAVTESPDSNEVIYTPPAPESPKSLIIKAIDQIIQGLQTLKQALELG